MDGVSYKHRDMFVPLACIERYKKMREVWYLESENPEALPVLIFFSKCRSDW